MIEDNRKTKNSLLDLIDRIILEHLLTGFCEKFNSGMKIICLDSKNELVFIKEGVKQEQLWSKICHVHRNILGQSKLCDEFDLEKTKELINSQEPTAHSYYCKPLKMIDIIAPIIVQKRVIGAIITGQRILENDAEKTLEEICKNNPECACEFKKAFSEEKSKGNQSKICTKSEVDNLLKELQSFADLIGGICDKVESNMLMIKKLKDEKNHRETFLERVAHSISLPLQSALIDTSNLVEEINTDDTKHLFNEIQGLVLVIQNILHGDDTTTIQEGKTYFKITHITKPLETACEMFKAEAQDKKCDLKVLVSVNNCIEIPIEISDLKDINSIYKKILIQKFPFFIEPKSEKWNFLIKQNESVKKINIRELFEYCYNLDENSTLKVFDAVTKEEIKFDISQLADYYMSPIEMNPEIIDLAYKNLIHNAIKYSFTTIPNRPRRYVSIHCFFGKNNVGIEFTNYGVGITNDEIENGKIWESRYRGQLSQDRNRTGAGLGLAHVKWAIEKVHKGKVSCTSVYQGGNAYLTKFKIIFQLKNKEQ
jgi:signal transduction histidine kinase/ligand-binding sensor protein